MVTTSYVSDAIRELEVLAKEAGIVVLNEVGVDPGVDHLYAIKKINEVHSKGGKVCSFEPLILWPRSRRVHINLLHALQVREFHSYCGGLPARRYSSFGNYRSVESKISLSRS